MEEQGPGRNRHYAQPREQAELADFRPLVIENGDGSVVTEEPPAWFLRSVEQARRNRVHGVIAARRVPVPARTGTRARGAGRPRARVQRGSRRTSRGSPASDDDGLAEPASRTPLGGGCA